jgi:hypothetical protein
MGNSLTESEFKKSVVKEHFASPKTCYDTLSQRYGADGDVFSDKPKYLFRGESRYFPMSTPGAYRAVMADYPLEIKQARIDATGLFVEDYEEQGGDSEVGECLAQHYLSTSDCLDFSASLGVALAFALDEKESDTAHSAYVVVLDYEKAKASRRFCLRDLREMHDALRPVRQHGFLAVHYAGNLFDLKNSECFRELGLVWFSFLVSNGDVVRRRHPCAPDLLSLYNIRGDLWAERMIEHLADLINNPSPQWGKQGLDHLVAARGALLSRTGFHSDRYR